MKAHKIKKDINFLFSFVSKLKRHCLSGKSFKIKLGLIVNYGRMRALSFLFLFFFLWNWKQMWALRVCSGAKNRNRKVISHLVVRSLGIWVNGTSGGVFQFIKNMWKICGYFLGLLVFCLACLCEFANQRRATTQSSIYNWVVYTYNHYRGLKLQGWTFLTRLFIPVIRRGLY